jgi:hypothetical protein
MAGSVGGLGAEHNGAAERVEAADQALGGAVLVGTVGVVGAEVGEGGGAPQHVEGSDQDLVRDGHGGLLRAYARPQPVELVAQVCALGSRDSGPIFSFKAVRGRTRWAFLPGW